MDFLQLTVRARSTNTLVDTIVFTEMEIVGGIKKTLPYDAVVQTTAEGYARLFPINRQTELNFEVLLEVPETVAKLGKLMIYRYAGHVFDVEVLTGLQFYSASYEGLVRDPSESVLLYGELTEFDRDYRNILSVGLEWRTPCKVQIKAGKRPSVPSQANFIATAPPVGGLGN